MKPRTFYKNFHIEIKQPSEKEVIDRGLICQYLSKLFPGQEAVNQLVSQPSFRSQGDKPQDIYTAQYLPFYLHDTEWLTAYTIQTIEGLQSAHKLKAKNVADFIDNSPAFDCMRAYYEKALVIANIRYLLKHKSASGVQDYDLVFREELVKMMQPLDIDKKTLEKYIEENSNIWLKPVMVQAFENKYAQLESLQLTNFWRHVYRNFKKAHQNLWIKNREYQYGEEHAEAIKSAGTLTKNMQMDIHKIKKIQEKLCEFENKLSTFSVRFKKSIFMVNTNTPIKQNISNQFNPNGVTIKSKD